MRFIVENPDITQVKEKLKKYIEIHNKKYDSCQVCCVLKVNDIQYLTCKPLFNLDYVTYPNFNIENQPCFSHLLEMRLTFISSDRHMTDDYYSKQPLPMCEIIFNQIRYKNPQFVKSPNRFIIYPFIQKHAEISAGEKDIV